MMAGHRGIRIQWRPHPLIFTARAENLQTVTSSTSVTPPEPETTRPTLRGTFGMVASTQGIATAAAQAVLERGGNAFDAAVAEAVVLHVVEPHLNGPGGDLVGIFATATATATDTAADPAQPLVLMGQGPAPHNATIEHFRAEGLDLVPGVGALAVAVPGTVDAWLLLLPLPLRDHGSWMLEDVFALARDYARHGRPLLGRVSATIAAVAELFETHWPSSAALRTPQGRVLRAGELLVNPAYADTLDRLADAGRHAASWEGRIDAARAESSAGFVAEAAARFVLEKHRHSSGTDRAGAIDEQDFAVFRASYEPAVTLDFRGVTVAKSAAWGQGPALLQSLAVLDGFDDERLDPSTALGAHTMLEAQKRSLADRKAHYGDVEVPLEYLLSAGYAQPRHTLITDRASSEFRPGSVPGVLAYHPPLRVSSDPTGVNDEFAGSGEPTVSTAGVTAGVTGHIDVVDAWGTMISVTPSGGWLQSSPTIPELGFCRRGRLQMMWHDPSSSSALMPGRRPRSTLTPTLILQGGHPIATLGTPGGDQQDQWQLLYLLRTLVGGYSPQEAIDAPAFHTTSFPDSFWPRTREPGDAAGR